MEEILEENVNIIKLTDEEGVESEFEFIDVIEYQGNDYVFLLPADEESDEVVILMVEEDEEGNETLSSVDDDETIEALFEMFKEKFSDMFDFAE